MMILLLNISLMRINLEKISRRLYGNSNIVKSNLISEVVQ
jgi:hypothetical protein